MPQGNMNTMTTPLSGYGIDRTLPDGVVIDDTEIGPTEPEAGSFTTLTTTEGFTPGGDITLSNGKAIQTGTTASNTALLKAYDTNDAVYRTFGTLTAGTTPSLALSAPSGGSLTGSFSTLATSTPLPIASGGTNAATAPAALVSLGLPPNAMVTSPYRTTRVYIVGFSGATTTATNTNELTTDTIYGIVGGIHTPTVVTALSMRTSGSNASAGASVKFGIYALDASGLPAARLGLTTSGTAIVDGATTTTYTGTLDAPVTLAAGVYLFAILPTAVTTQARASVYTSTAAWSGTSGSASAGAAFAVNAIIGYTGTASYATGLPATFGAATPVTSAGNAPAIAYTIQ